MGANEHPTTGALVWHLAMRWRAAVDRAVAPFGLTHAQYSVLASLRELTGRGEEPSQRRLAEYTGLGPIYVSKLVRALERGGTVARSPDPSDARAVLLTLTPEGVDVIDRAVVVVHTLNGELASPLGTAELRAFRSALQTLLHTDIPNGGEPIGEPIGEPTNQARRLVAAQPHDSGAKTATYPLELTGDEP